MKKLIYLSLLCFTTTLLLDCDHKTDKQPIKKAILDCENQIAQNPYANSDSLPKQLAALYLKYASSYPSDSLSAEYLFRAADIKRGTGNAKEAVLLLDQVRNDYPNYSKMPVVIFAQGYISQSDLKQDFKAKAYYQELIKKFPNHPLAKDANTLIATLGMTDAEMLKYLQEKATNAGQ